MQHKILLAEIMKNAIIGTFFPTKTEELFGPDKLVFFSSLIFHARTWSYTASMFICFHLNDPVGAQDLDLFLRKDQRFFRLWCHFCFIKTFRGSSLGKMLLLLAKWSSPIHYGVWLVVSVEERSFNTLPRMLLSGVEYFNVPVLADNSYIAAYG